MRGQALVEFALVVPVFVGFVFAVIQVSLVFIWFYSETSVTRDTARWLAVHANTQDLAVANHVQVVLLPGMQGGTPALVRAGSASLDTIYQVGNMQVAFTPCLPAGSPATCTHPSRAPGSTLHMQMRYDVSNLMFLPSTYQLGWMSFTLPTALPAYTVYVMAE